MPDIKEKPGMDKPRALDRAALLPQQAGRLLKEKYLRQLGQHQPDEDAEEKYATGQVESGTRWAVAELTSTITHRPVKERRETIKPESHTKEPEREDAAPTDAGASD